MKITQNVRRKIIQVAAFGFTNSHITNFVGGKIYRGSWKNFCSPGLNCYSCPAAGLGCPIGAMQSVEGSPKFSISFYMIGFVLALGVRPNNPLEAAVKAMGLPVCVIGDANQPGPANKATEAALEAVLKL